MKNTAELHLIIPGICGPVAETELLETSHVVKKWLTTLTKSQLSESYESVYDVLATLVGLSKEDDFPSAALTLWANNNYDTTKYYMHADPVHLQADLDHAILTSSADLNITDDESIDLCNMLNQHFAQDGLVFQRLNKDEWLLISPEKIEMNTTPLSQSVARNVNFILPKGKSSDYWKKILTEAQMLMFSSDVNIIRESKGEQSINSLWFHGSGEVPSVNDFKVSSICSDGLMLKGLARYFNIDYMSVPATADDYFDYLLKDQQNGINLFHFSELEHLVNYTDSHIWQEKLEEVLEKWIYPLIKFANKNAISVMLHPCNEKQYRFTKYDVIKFWRKVKIDDHISAYSQRQGI